MKVLMKIFRVLLSIVMLLVILLLCVFLFWLGPTVKFAAETVGTKALGAPLTINELSISPLKGTFHLSGFRMANQDKFGRTNLVSLASLDISMDMGSLFSRTVVVHQVELNSPYFTYEQGSATDNITESIRNIQEFLGIDPAAPPDPQKLEKEQKKKEKKAQRKKEKGSKRVIVESLVINDVQCHSANTDDPRLDLRAGFEKLYVSMTNGTINLKNLHVSNPSMLDTPNLFTLDAIAIALDPESIYSDTVSIRDVQILRPYAYLEQNRQTDTAAEFMKIAEQFSTTSTNAPTEPVIDTPADTEQEESVAGPPPVALHNLLVDDIQIKLLDSSATNAPAEPRMLAGIGSISVRLVDGNIQIKGITVPNPEGFVSENLFHLANIDITLEPGSLFSSQTIIKEVFVNAPTINLEQTETSGNVSELTDTLMGFVPPAGVAEGAPTPEAAPQTGERPEPIPLAGQPVVLHGLAVTNLAINLSLPIDTNSPASGSMTNETEASEAIDSEPMKLIAFDRLDIAPLDGTIQIANLQVSNPKGFANKHLVTLEQFKLDIDPDSLQSDTLLIRDILFDKPRIAYERKIATDNIKALQAEIEKAVSRREEYVEEEEVPESTAPTEGEAAGQKVIIEHLLVQDGRVKAKISALPSALIPLLDIEMKDMGKAEGGTSPGQAISSIGTAFYDAIIGSVSGATGLAGDALKGAGSMTLGTLENVTGLLSGTSAPTAEDEEEMPVTKDTSEEAAQPEEPAEEKKPRRRLFRRGTGRFF